MILEEYMELKWWQKRNIYQIYLRSFFDANGDGIGDLRGLIQKLPYLQKLGIGIVWISPHYDSPMDDNGYDVRDFFRVSPDYGTLVDFKELIDTAHRMDIKIITDLILNHTSDEHPWFVAAKDPSHPEHARFHDYYIWQKPKIDEKGEKMRPTRWMGWFGNPTWDYNEATDEYYLHIFSKKMPDLNWHNKRMKSDIKAMIRWWIGLGIDGFRVDASNHLEKNWSFPDAFPGYENFSSLPKHHEYLQELGTEIFVPCDVLTIGESGGATQSEALQYAGFGSNEFNMLIQFGHCWADVAANHPRLMGKWAQGTVNVPSIKYSFKNWYDMLNNQGWNVIYWHNHDQPRVLSHYGSDGTLRIPSAKMLAISLYFMPGTAICYQGEEIGMTNVMYDHLEDFRDVEVFTEFNNFKKVGYSDTEALGIIKARCRDNARTPMQWDNTFNAGFSTGTPWIKTNFNYPTINVASQEHDPDSILSLYRTILNLRNQDENIRAGKLTFFDLDSSSNFSYLNQGPNADYLVVCNFSGDSQTFAFPKDTLEHYTLLVTNGKADVVLLSTMSLSPYETQVWRRQRPK
jgi:oligo-1,6-glucosidase